MAHVPLDLKGLKRSISLGNIHQVIEELMAFTEGSSSSMTTEIYHTAARFRQLESEKIRGMVTLQDYKVEFNSIISSLLEIIDLIQHAAVGTFQQVNPVEEVRKELAALSAQFKETDTITSFATNIRMKIHIARKMAEKLVPWTNLINEYKGTDDPAMICAIGRKVKIVADEADLDVLETIVPNANSNITKGFLTNALAELIYAGQLRWGDEERVKAMLATLGKKEGEAEKGDKALMTNIVRVEAALEVLTRHTS
ncbi:MAG: hypothetical protein AAFN92_21030 [Bacteroidota bacterium]